MGKKKSGLGIFEFGIFIASIVIILLFFLAKIANIDVKTIAGREYSVTIKFLDLIKGVKLDGNSTTIDFNYYALKEELFYFVFIIPIIIGLLVFIPKFFDKIVILIEILLSTIGTLLTIYAFRFLKGIEALENSSISIGSSEIHIVNISIEYSVFLYAIMFLYLGILSANIIRYLFRR